MDVINDLLAHYQEAALLSDPDQAVVIVVDDDASMRGAIAQIGRTLEVSHRTVDIHRRHVMEKMGASTLPALVRMRLLAVERN